MLSHWVRRILQATVYDVAIETPLDAAPLLSARLHNTVRLKREDLQPVFSFKLRGAYNRISQLSAGELARGVICASAGNHAQGVAFSGQKLGIRTLIVMPRTTPDIKVNAVKRLGGEVILEGDSFDVANRFALQKAEAEGLVYIPPYDDALVIAGQGTVAMELLRQWRNVDCVFVPVGGGGLMAGVAAYLGEVAPHVQVIAVEPEDAACLKLALDSGERRALPQVGLFADGVAVAQIGALPFEVARLPKSDGSGPVVDPQVVTCSTDEICAAVKDVFDETRSIAEPAGALAVAGLKKYVQQHGLQGKHLVALVSGANMNFDRLRYIAERTELGEGREAILAISLPEQVGAFLTFCRALQGRGITEFNYRYNGSNSAQIFVGIALKGQIFDERQRLVQSLQEKGYGVDDLSDDETAKLHIRHLVGGHAGLADERVFRLEFPERPGALLNFLEKLGQQFNISLFHYRNHGAAEGRVLVGLQLGTHREAELQQGLAALGYPVVDITDSVGYRLFLR
jgi:threonine dehydratase